jgi:hypothetical protein
VYFSAGYPAPQVFNKRPGAINDLLSLIGCGFARFSRVTKQPRIFAEIYDSIHDGLERCVKFDG